MRFITKVRHCEGEGGGGGGGVFFGEKEGKSGGGERVWIVEAGGYLNKKRMRE